MPVASDKTVLAQHAAADARGRGAHDMRAATAAENL
jgi:hypothetical protein